MKYPIQVRVVRGKGFLSGSVALETHSDVSHAEFVVPEKEIALGAYYPQGIAMRPINYTTFEVERRYVFDGIEAAYDWAFTQIGKPYDRTAIIGILLDRNWRDPDGWFCSELIAMGSEQAGKPLFRVAAKINAIYPCTLELSTGMIPISKEEWSC